MKIALGLKAHSGWAALVALAAPRGRALQVVDRRRVELLPSGTPRAPYHAAEDLELADAERVVEQVTAAARRGAQAALRAAARRAQGAGQEVRACAVLVGAPMPAWSVAEIRAVHFRMHQAEGALFRDALVQAAGGCGIPLVALPEKTLLEHASRALGEAPRELMLAIAELGRAAGPPWAKDQKDAALAAWVALRARMR